MKKALICINCPLGCPMTADIENNQVTSVTGNGCKRGKEYAAQEAILPMRVLTGNMRADGCVRPFSVKSDGTVPKDMLIQCAMELRNHRPNAPIQRGQIVITDILGTGVNIIATQDFE